MDIVVPRRRHLRETDGSIVWLFIPVPEQMVNNIDIIPNQFVLKFQIWTWSKRV